MGVFLLLIVSGLVISTLGYFDTTFRLLSQSHPSLCLTSESCILGSLVWNLTEILPQRQFPGLVLRALFGYTDQLYLVQAIAYLGFLAITGTLYFQSLSGQRIFPKKAITKDLSA